MSVTVTPPPALGPITVTGGDPLSSVRVMVAGSAGPATVTLPPPLLPPVVRLPGADLGRAELPEYADYPAQTVQRRTEDLIDLKADRTFPGLETFVLTDGGAQDIVLAQRARPGTLELFVNGLLQTDLSDVLTDNFTLTLPESWQLMTGDALGVRYEF